MVRQRERIAGKVIGFSMAAVSLLHVFLSRGNGQIALACGFLTVICVTDALWSRIPNWATATFLVAGLLCGAVLAGPKGVESSALGALIGLSLLLLPFLKGGFGGGDVKALAALGALLGPRPVLNIFVYMAVAGGMLGILHYLLAHDLRTKVRQGRNALMAYTATKSLACLRPDRSETLRFPYAAAIAAGFFVYVQWGFIL